MAGVISRPHLRRIFDWWLEPCDDLVSLWRVLGRPGIPEPVHEQAAARFEKLAGMPLWHPTVVGGLQHSVKLMRAAAHGEKIKAKVNGGRRRGRPPELLASFKLLMGEPWFFRVPIVRAAMVAIGVDGYGAVDDGTSYDRLHKLFARRVPRT